MATLGSVGLGMVWGWWLVLVGGARWQRPWPTLLTLIFPSILLLLFLGWRHQWPTALAFLIASLLAFFTHIAWRQKFRPQPR